MNGVVVGKKVVLITDPGIDGAFATILALHEPSIELLGVLPTAGNVSSSQATVNAQIILEQVDPPRWPRIGSAIPIEYDTDGTRLHGSNGLGGIDFPTAKLHRLTPSDKLLVDLVKQHKHEVSVVIMGPCTLFAKAIEREPELPSLIEKLVVLGGTWHEPGNSGPVSEFHFFCDPASAQKTLHCGAHTTLLPLDVMRRLVFSPSELLQMPCQDSKASQFLKKIVSHGIGATSAIYGIEGFHLKDVLGLIPLILPGKIKTKTVCVNVETHGHLTRGMSVIDTRWGVKKNGAIEMAVDFEELEIRSRILRIMESF